MIRYAISSRASFDETEQQRRDALARQAERLSREGIEYLQIREKDLGPGDLLSLAREVIEAARSAGSMKVLLNGTAEQALQSGADGVHLQIDHLQSSPLFTSVSCHSEEDICRAVEAKADLILYGPVFEKQVLGERVQQGIGLEALHRAVQIADCIPVLALGGVNRDNMQSCLQAGAAGVAAIRMFLK